MRRAIASLALAATALAGCTLEPHYVRPAPIVPRSWPVGDAYLQQSEAGLPTVSYRDVFRDPKLQAIIDQALRNNQDLAVAIGNVAAARAQYHIQRADLFPQVDANARVTTGDSGNGGSSTGQTGGGVHTSYNVNVGLTAFQIDLFGRIRSLSHAALQQYFASEAAVRAARLTIIAEVANAWLTLAADRSLLAIAEDTEKSAADTVRLTQARLNGGVAPGTDLAQAQTILAQAQSDRAELTTAVAQDRNALELLAGGPVADSLLPTGIEDVTGSLAEVPAGLDSRILLRRPDVVEAEYQLRAANARIGAARAAFFPTISLTGLAGLASNALTSLFTGGAFTWSVGPSASVPIFQGGALSGNLALSRADRDIAVAEYQRAIQTAFREVSDALARRGTIDKQLAAQQLLLRSADTTYRLDVARYREGIDPYLDTLVSQRTLYSARRSLIATELIRAQNLVSLYQTLGGDQSLDVPPAETVGPVPAGR